MFNSLKRWIGKTKPKQRSQQAGHAKTNPEQPPQQTGGDLELPSGFIPTEIGVTVDPDRFKPEVRKALDQELIRQAGVPLFHGAIEHAYSLSTVGAADPCPRCHMPTKRHCANFIYATDRGMRVMLAPAGFFCTACPTVIIDEELIVRGVSPGFKFQGVIGIDDPDRNEPSLFHTWNGEKPVYIFDENQQCLGLETLGKTRPWGEDWEDIGSGPSPAHHRQKLKRKRKLAKLARKRNRHR